MHIALLMFHAIACLVSGLAIGVVGLLTMTETMSGTPFVHSMSAALIVIGLVLTRMMNKAMRSVY